MIESHPVASDDVALYVLQSMGYGNHEEIGKIIPFLICCGEEYVRNYLRLECIKTFDKAKTSLTIYGKGWGGQNFDNIRVRSPVDYMQSLHVMQQSKFVLNASPMFPCGTHERIFSAMLNGAISVTDRSKFLRGNLIRNKELIDFTWQDLELLPEKIKELLSKPKKMQSLATRGREKALSDHTWFNRAKEILKVVEAVNLSYEFTS